MGVTYEARQVDTVLTSWLASCGLLWQHQALWLCATRSRNEPPPSRASAPIRSPVLQHGLLSQVLDRVREVLANLASDGWLA